MPEWTEHIIWWHVYPLGFVGADTSGADASGADPHASPVPRLRRLEPWLDHLVALGANGLALGPVFASSSHGYDTADYHRVDPRLGDTADLEHLIAEAHVRGIRVMLDGVFNHVGRSFAPLVAALADPGAPENALFRREADGSLATFEGHDALVALEHTDPAVVELVTDVMCSWLDRGADAWRLDAAYAMPAGFWAQVLPRVRVRHPDVLIVGEVLHGDYAGVVSAATLDSVTQYELWQAIWHATSEANFFELDWALQRHNDFVGAFVPYTFVGNHDVTRIASQLPDERHHAHAIVLLLTLGGMPSVYYGDEVGLRAVKEERVGGDDAIRPEYPADVDRLAEEAGQTGTAVLALHRELVALRRRHPWLVRASSSALALANETYVYEVSGEAAGSSGRLVVALNLSDAALTVTAESARAGVVLAGQADASDGAFTLPAHGWAVLGEED
jgi:cyclomaltodextrinase